MIEWLRRVHPDRPFLAFDGRSWTYGEAVAEVESRITRLPRLIQPSLEPESVFDLLAGMSGGGATVIGPEPEATVAGDSDLVVFTSGSTGPPKGVRLSLLNLQAAASASADHLGHGPDDDWLLAMPLHHVGGISILVRQAYSGGSVTLLPRFDPDDVAAAMKGRVTMVSLVPTMLARLLDRGPFSGLRAVLVGGGPIPSGLLEMAGETGIPVLPTYGMTETFGQVATLRPDSPLAYEAHPLPGVDVRIEPDGRIALRSPQISSGYLGEPDRTDPWFVTNDIGELQDDGAIRVMGRADTMVVTGGENVSPERVEAVVRQHPEVADAVVVGVPDAVWGQMVVCLHEGGPDDLGEWVGLRLPGFMVPKRWLRVDALPKTSIGKPDREAAARLVEQLRDRRSEPHVE
ncbi:MAG TPA: AMP-binding protein [Acidimicrobiia bacterium]|nr:AMP-binding protein [Acidimicrobiia bacterium]